MILVKAIAFVFAFIRSTRFDIKKFNFTEDLEDVDIHEEDREEVELQIEFDYDIVDFMQDYGVVENETKTGTKTTREAVELLPNKIRKKNTYYFKVPKESSKITFTIRNYKYEYTM